jgi:hypothetical protein
MTPDIKTVEAILRQHWEIPSDLGPRALNDHLFKIQVLVGQKYSHQNLKYQLSLIQTKKLRQHFDDKACDQIASDLLRVANA